ncbi:hypothetical protein FF100_22155 [Methylobacterium terricola]|uniref:Uncharacterized protein n=1 Tax=Methylobacterium terricola TaxID=2583531 RepID=A0A5C4LFC2_9HYPH|nr:hypothetical protein [Methylobacterium terricola]TNC10857.1 hypothetical protein FF100_22155 [Methylobacterium terricola]
MTVILYRDTHKSWEKMRERCHNSNNENFKNYGARGISVDPRWDDFGKFVEDMGLRPTGMTLDRIDNDGPYTKANCRWATSVEQARNKRNSVLLTYRGQTKHIRHWCEELGINYWTARLRRQKGCSVEEILSTENLPTNPPSGSRLARPINTPAGPFESQSAAAKHFGLTRARVSQLVKRGTNGWGRA